MEFGAKYNISKKLEDKKETLMMQITKFKRFHNRKG